MHKIIDLGDGEFALIGVHHSVDSFVDIMNRDNRVSQMMREYIEPYEDGESFHLSQAQLLIVMTSSEMCTMPRQFVYRI